MGHSAKSMVKEMMKKTEFYKLQASGNDFILLDAFHAPHFVRRISYKKFARTYCERKFGVGADGLLVIEPSKKAQFKMRIFNPDGSEPDMCGNGARCVALWFSRKQKAENRRQKNMKFETRAGIIESWVKGNNVRIKLGNPTDIELDMPIHVLGRKIKVNYINTGVPHAVVFVEGLELIDVYNIGRALRYHSKFQPEGTNVNFVEPLSSDFIKIRTYERGVEAETLACGTGVTASAVITDLRLKTTSRRVKIKVKAKSGEVLKIYFDKTGNNIDNVWLEGEACLVYKGQLALDA